jgi:hypothetical protein
MQAGTNVTLDANAAIPSDIRADDPRHLGNLTKNMTKINAQVSSDTKYDPTPPPRVDSKGNPVKEKFTAELGASDMKLVDEKLYALGALAAIVGITVLVVFLDPKLRLPISKVNHGYVFLSAAGLICLLTIFMVTRARQANEVIRWYPQR